MGGEEILAEWSGDLESGYITTTATAQRFCASSQRYKLLKFYHESSAHYSYLGKYYVTAAEFENKAFAMWPLVYLKFEYADLYEFAAKMAFGSGAVKVKWIGINRY